jgi:hypothetical protein
LLKASIKVRMLETPQNCSSMDSRLSTLPPWVPSFLPASKTLPKAGTSLYFDHSELSFIQTDIKRPVEATSLVPIGSFSRLLAVPILAFLAFTLAARWIARRFLRNYFALSSVRVPELKEALPRGEGQSVEL